MVAELQRHECESDHNASFDLAQHSCENPPSRQQKSLHPTGASFPFLSFATAFVARLLCSVLLAEYCWSIQAFAIPTANARTRAITPTRSVTEIALRASRILK